MKPRHRAQARLARHVPGIAESSERLPMRRIGDREEGGRPEPRVPSETVRVQEEVKIKPLRTVPATPNAPLLIRLVRSPYALPTGRAVRTVDESRARLSLLDREPFPNPGAEIAELRASMKVARPMRDLPHHPVLRPHPFGRVRALAVPEGAPFDPRFADPDGGWL